MHKIITLRINIKIVVIYTVLLFALCSCAIVQKSATPNPETQIFIDRGVAFMEHQKWDLAEASFRVAIENQQVPQAYDGLGCVLLAKGQINEAKQIFEDIVNWFPDYTEVFWHLAYLEEQQGNLVVANDWHTKAVLANPLGYKQKTNYALFLQDRYNQYKTDNLSRKLAISYLDDVKAIIGNQTEQNMSTIDSKPIRIRGAK